MVSKQTWNGNGLSVYYKHHTGYIVKYFPPSPIQSVLCTVNLLFCCNGCSCWTTNITAVSIEAPQQALVSVLSNARACSMDQCCLVDHPTHPTWSTTLKGQKMSLCGSYSYIVSGSKDTVEPGQITKAQLSGKEK